VAQPLTNPAPRGQHGELERRCDAERLRLLEAVVAQATDIVIITEAAPLDVAGPRIVYVNDAFTRVTGYTAGEVIGRTPRLLQGPGTDRAPLDTIRAALTRRESASVEVCNYRKDGTLFWSDMTVAPVADGSGVITHFVSVQRDVTERHAAAAALRHQALHDTLTGLPNRALLRDRLEHGLHLAQRDGVPLALLLLDLDGFKRVNDTRGHDVGDLLLQVVADRLRVTLRAADTVGRLGGDEFAALLPGATTAGATEAARALLSALAAPVALGGQTVVVGASVGIALFPAHGADAATLLRRADAAMYAAKRAGGGYALAAGDAAREDAGVGEDA